MTGQRAEFDWRKIQEIAQSQFDASLRKEIQLNFIWYRSRSDDYASDASSADFVRALKALEALNRSSFSRFQVEPIAEELTTVRWYLDVLAQAPSEQSVSIKYLLYFRIWRSIGKAGVKLTQGKGIPNHRLSHAQQVFREVCRQAGVEFTSDQALADALKRALQAMRPTGAE